MATRRVLFALLAACLLLAITPVSFADSHARIVRLSDIEGSVQIDRNTGNGFERAIMNMPITQGMKLETGSSGRAEVEFENGSALRLADNTSVDFSDLTLRSNGDRSTEVRVNDGTVYVNYKHKGGDEFRLDARNQALNLDHDVHFRLNLSGNDAQVAVFNGELKVPNDNDMAKVKKGETVNFDLNNPSQVAIEKGINSLGSDDWDSGRMDYNRQYASTYNSSQYPYQYGYSDLNYYGGFFNAPGYGTLWRPYGVSSMWDPYGNGAWAYYPGYGYTWVSSYPWGWMPYRYGTWVYVPAYGWAWQPGGWNNWNAYPVYMNAPPTWHHPVAPPVTSRPGSTVIVGTPFVDRPLRTMRNGVPYGSPAAGALPGATGIPGRPNRSITPGQNENSALSHEAQPPSAINRAVPVDKGSQPASRMPAYKAEQLGLDSSRRTGGPYTPAPKSTAPPATAPKTTTPTPAPRPSVQPTPAPRPSMTPGPAPRSAPAPRPAPVPHSSMSSPHMGMPSGMHPMGMPSAHPAGAGRPTGRH